MRISECNKPDWDSNSAKQFLIPGRFLLHLPHIRKGQIENSTVTKVRVRKKKKRKLWRAIIAKVIEEVLKSHSQRVILHRKSHLRVDSSSFAMDRNQSSWIKEIQLAPNCHLRHASLLFQNGIDFVKLVASFCEYCV